MAVTVWAWRSVAGGRIQGLVGFLSYLFTVEDKIYFSFGELSFPYFCGFKTNQTGLKITMYK